MLERGEANEESDGKEGKENESGGDESDEDLKSTGKGTVTVKAVFEVCFFRYDAVGCFFLCSTCHSLQEGQIGAR